LNELPPLKHVSECQSNPEARHFCTDDKCIYSTFIYYS